MLAYRSDHALILTLSEGAVMQAVVLPALPRRLWQCFLRGVPECQIPTMIALRRASSVGGKASSTRERSSWQESAGNFYSFVRAHDPASASTLPAFHRSGLAGKSSLPASAIAKPVGFPEAR